MAAYLQRRFFRFYGHAHDDKILQTIFKFHKVSPHNCVSELGIQAYRLGLQLRVSESLAKKSTEYNFSPIRYEDSEISVICKVICISSLQILLDRKQLSF